jgi:DNA-binding transcriptional LysR family regulator
MDLNDLLVFTRVVQSGSFTAAARLLGMTKSSVSRRVTELEDRIGARLLQRTTRKLSLTDVGRAYYASCARIIAEVEEAELAVSQMQAAPRGTLRVSVPLTFSLLGGIAAEFLRRYPPGDRRHRSPGRSDRGRVRRRAAGRSAQRLHVDRAVDWRHEAPAGGSAELPETSRTPEDAGRPRSARVPHVRAGY